MSDLFRAIESNSDKNMAHFKRMAMAHYMAISGRPIQEYEALYDAIRAVIAPMVRLAVPMPIHALGVFVGEGKFPPSTSQAEVAAAGALGVGGAIIPVSMKDGPGAGECVVELDGIENSFVVCGGIDRLTNPARPDYEPDAKSACVSMAHLVDAKVASILMAMGPSDASGIEVALQNVLDSSKEYGRCDVVMLGSPRRDNVSVIRASSDEHVAAIRRLIDQSGHLAPVYRLQRNELFKVIDPFSTVDDEPAKFREPAKQLYFTVGDVVSMKRSASNPDVSGTITDVSNGCVTVEWEDGERAMFDMAEALMRLSSAPVTTNLLPSGVLYATPGMRDDAIEMLSSMGIDPVSVYAMASHCRPASSQALGWREKLVDSMASMGLPGAFTNGFAERDDGFMPCEWFESRLPNGYRLIVDLSHRDPTVMAGIVDEYVVSVDIPQVW